MALRDIVIQTKEVSLGGGQSFTVSGITANQVFGVFFRHQNELTPIFDQITSGEEVTLEGMVASFPLLVAEIIALGAGGNPFDTAPYNSEDPNSITNWQADLRAASSFPFPVQAEALSKIADLTFTPEMPPKKFFGLLLQMVQGAKASASQT